jgi:hypothetical protein
VACLFFLVALAAGSTVPAARPAAAQGTQPVAVSMDENVNTAS